MPITMGHDGDALEEQVLADMAHEGFTVVAKDYSPSTTEPHHHDVDICLHIIAGEFRLTEVDAALVHRFGPGDRVFVPRGTRHAEDHDELRMVVGRRS